jgi:hypothetical protein
VTLVLFHLVELKLIKVFDTDLVEFLKMGSDIGQATSEMRRAPFEGLQVILYLGAGTDSAQPIRVVRDSCVKGETNKMLVHHLRNLIIQ